MMMGYGSEQAELYLQQELPEANIVKGIDSEALQEKASYLRYLMILEKETDISSRHSNTCQRS